MTDANKQVSRGTDEQRAQWVQPKLESVPMKEALSGPFGHKSADSSVGYS